MTRQPSLRQFFVRYPNEHACQETLRKARWGNGFCCPRCKETENWHFLEKCRKYQCNACRYQCSITAGTVFQDHKLPLQTYFLALYLIATTKKGISQPDLARKLGIAENTAHFLAHKMMRVLAGPHLGKMVDFTEVDEAIVTAKKAKKSSRKGRGKPGHARSQERLMFLVEARGKGIGKVRIEHIPDATSLVGRTIVQEHVAPGATVYTDGGHAYSGLDQHDHVALPNDPEKPGRQIPRVHLVISNFKKVLLGVHTHSSVGLLQAYANTFSYRSDHRHDLEAGFRQALVRASHTKPWKYSKITAAAA